MSAAHGSTALGRSVPRQRLGSVVAAVFTVGLLSGCTSSAEPTPLPEPTVSTSPSARPGVTPPGLPPEAEGTSPRAAKAFVRYWVETLNYATVTGDTRRLLELSSTKCESCASAVKKIDDVYLAGGSVQSNGWSISTMDLLPNQKPSSPVIAAGIRLSPQTVVKHAGANEQEFRGGRLPATFYLHWSAGSWRVVRLERSA